MYDAPLTEMDLSRSLDMGPWTAFQKTVLALTSVALTAHVYPAQIRATGDGPTPISRGAR